MAPWLTSVAQTTHVPNNFLWSQRCSSHWSLTVFFLFFLENRIWHFMQIVSLWDNLHGVRFYFLGKIRKNIINMSSAESAHSMVSVKILWPINTNNTSIWLVTVLRFNSPFNMFSAILGQPCEHLHICTAMFHGNSSTECTIITLSIRTDTCKQCRPRSDAAESGIWSGSTLFATHPTLLQAHQQVVKWTISNFRTNMLRRYGVPILRVNKVVK